MKDYLKYFGYNLLTVLILFAMIFIFYFYFSDVSIESNYHKVSEYNYVYTIKINNGWDFNLGELSMVIHDLAKAKKNECYNFATGGQINLSTSFSRCEISRNTNNTEVNVLPIHCDYFDRFGEIEISWYSSSRPQNCSFIIDYSHEGPSLASFKIPRTKIMKFTEI